MFTFASFSFSEMSYSTQPHPMFLQLGPQNFHSRVVTVRNCTAPGYGALAAGVPSKQPTRQTQWPWVKEIWQPNLEIQNDKMWQDWRWNEETRWPERCKKPRKGQKKTHWLKDVKLLSLPTRQEVSLPGIEDHCSNATTFPVPNDSRRFTTVPFLFPF